MALEPPQIKLQVAAAALVAAVAAAAGDRDKFLEVGAQGAERRGHRAHDIK